MKKNILGLLIFCCSIIQASEGRLSPLRRSFRMGEEEYIVYSQVRDAFSLSSEQEDKILGSLKGNQQLLKFCYFIKDEERNADNQEVSNLPADQYRITIREGNKNISRNGTDFFTFILEKKDVLVKKFTISYLYKTKEGKTAVVIDIYS